MEIAFVAILVGNEEKLLVPGFVFCFGQIDLKELGPDRESGPLTCLVLSEGGGLQ